MASIHETAYPRLKSSLSEKELERHYTPTEAELALALRCTSGNTARLGFLVLLKTFQRLGYFVKIGAVPQRLVAHMAKYLGFPKTPDLSDYDDSGSRRRHVTIVRDFQGIRPYGEEAKRLLLDAAKEAALTKEDPADIINVGIEELSRMRFELPGFTTVHRIATYARFQVNSHFHLQVCSALGERARDYIDTLFNVAADKNKSSWELLKKDPGRPTLNNLTELLTKIEWLRSLSVDLDVCVRSTA